MLDPDERAEVTHRIFVGARADDYDLVRATLKGYEKAASNRGHLQGFLVGLVIGAVIGVMVAGLPSCGEPDHSISNSASAASRGSSSF
jgi:hypothetical protein